VWNAIDIEANTKLLSVNFEMQSPISVRRKATSPGLAITNRNFRSELTSSSLISCTDEAETDEYLLYHM